MGNHESKALVDTGAFNSALPLSIFSRLSQSPDIVVSKRKVPCEYVTVATGAKARVLTRATIKIKVMGKEISEEFMILDCIQHVILGISFFEKNDISIDCKSKRLHFPDMTAQMNEMLSSDGKKKKKVYPRNTYPVYTSKKMVIRPNEQSIILCKIEGLEEPENVVNLCGIIDPLASFEKRTDLCVTSSLSKANRDGLFPVGIINLQGTPVTLNTRTAVGKLKILSPQQIEFLMPIDPLILKTVESHCETKKEVDAAISTIYQMNRRRGRPRNRRSNASDTDNSINLISSCENRKFWFATPETCEDPSTLTGVEKDIYEQLVEFKRLEAINPQNSPEERAHFLGEVNWEKSIFDEKHRALMEDLLVEYQHIFAKHRLDIGGNDEFKVKLTPAHDEPVYTQPNPMPIHLKRALTLELSLQQAMGIIATIDYSKYSSPIFAQKKPNGSLRILIDLRRINFLLRHDYESHNFPISSMADVGEYLAGKAIFSKLDASNAYHALKLKDDLSKQMLAFNFNGRTYAYQTLAQGLSRSVTAFSSFMRKYLDSCIASGKCFQYVDDIGSATNSQGEMIANLREIFKCIEKAGLRLSMKKCEFGVPKITFLGNTITSQGMAPNKKKVDLFLAKLKMPRTTKQVKRWIGFLQFFRAFLPSLSVKLIPFYRLLKNDTPFVIGPEHVESFKTLREDLSKATETYLRLPQAGLQYIIIADASFYGAGYVLMVEDHCKDRRKEDKILAPVSFGSKVFNPAQLKLSIYAKEFLAVYYAFDAFAHILWGAQQKDVLVLTDNKALAYFFQSKSIPAPLWTFLDKLMAFPFELGHIPGLANPAADFLSRLQLNPSEKLTLRMKDSIPIHRIELDIAAQTPPLINAIIPSDEWILTNKERVGDPPDVSLISPEQQVLTTIAAVLFSAGSQKYEVTSKIKLVRSGLMNMIAEPNPLDSFDMTTRRTPVNWYREQGRDPLIRKVMRWVNLNQAPDVQYTTPEENKFVKQLPRLTIRDGVLYRKFFDDTGRIQRYQTVVPKQLRQELLYRIHNTELMGHKGISKTIQEFRQKFYFPGFTEFLADYIRNCQSCAQTKPIRASLITPPLQEMMTKVSYPGHMLQIDIVGAMKPSGGYKYILTAIDVFSRFMFAAPMRQQSALAVAKELMGIFLRNAYVPDTIVTDCGTAFTSALIKELTGLLEIEIRHATVKHSQTMGTIERAHASLKKVLKIYEGKTGNEWHKHVDYAVFCHNTSYHATIGCTPSLIFHGREPITPLDVRFGRPRMKTKETRYQYVTEVQEEMTRMNQTVRENAIASYQKYRSFFDRKANAQPLKLHSYCLLLNPKLTTQNMTAGRHRKKWIPLFRVAKVLTNMNYIVRKVGTNYTQCVHRIRLREIVPQYEFQDLEVIDHNEFRPHKEYLEHTREPETFDKVLPDLILDGSDGLEISDCAGVLYHVTG